MDLQFNILNLQDKIAEQLSILILELKDKHNELGMKATGLWLDSLGYEVDGLIGRIKGQHYTEYLVQGREPGKRPPISPIETWVKAKFGISGKEATGIAYAVATKIGQEGTTWFQQGGSDLLDAVLTESRIREMYIEVGRHISWELSQELIRELVA